MTKLREIAHSRTGDKGNTSNISVIAYKEKHWRRRGAIERRICQPQYVRCQHRIVGHHAGNRLGCRARIVHDAHQLRHQGRPPREILRIEGLGPQRRRHRIPNFNMRRFQEMRLRGRGKSEFPQPFGYQAVCQFDWRCIGERRRSRNPGLRLAVRRRGNRAIRQRRLSVSPVDGPQAEPA